MPIYSNMVASTTDLSCGGVFPFGLHMHVFYLNGIVLMFGLIWVLFAFLQTWVLSTTQWPFSNLSLFQISQTYYLSQRTWPIYIAEWSGRGRLETPNFAVQRLWCLEAGDSRCWTLGTPALAVFALGQTVKVRVNQPVPLIHPHSFNPGAPPPPPRSSPGAICPGSAPAIALFLPRAARDLPLRLASRLTWNLPVNLPPPI
jgi:hypothetical protein